MTNASESRAVRSIFLDGGDTVGREAAETAASPSELLTAIRSRECVQRRLLAGADGLAALTAVALAALITSVQLAWPAVFVILVAIAIAKLQGLYDRDELVLLKSTLHETPKLLEVVAVTGVTVYFGREQFLSASGSPAFFCLVVLLMSALIIAGRGSARRIARNVVPPEQCIGVGDQAVFSRLKHRMAGLKGSSLVASVPTHELPISVDELQALAVRLNAHRIIIAPEPQALDNQTASLISSAREAGLRVSVLPGAMAALGGGPAVDQFGGYTIVGVPHFGLSRSSAVIKRAFDLLSAMVALIAVAPLILAAAVWIKLDSPGPVLFRQTRVGRDGRRFYILKLRSMVDGADAMKRDLLHLNEAADGRFKIAADPRVTRSGLWLRRTRADELPQLLNVLRGEMSLVGPRPLVVRRTSESLDAIGTGSSLCPG